MTTYCSSYHQSRQEFAERKNYRHQCREQRKIQNLQVESRKNKRWIILGLVFLIIILLVNALQVWVGPEADPKTMKCLFNPEWKEQTTIQVWGDLNIRESPDYGTVIGHASKGQQFVATGVRWYYNTINLDDNPPYSSSFWAQIIWEDSPSGTAWVIGSAV